MSTPHQKAGVDRLNHPDSESDVSRRDEHTVTCDWPGEIAVTKEEVDLVISFLGKEIQKLLGE